MSDFLLEVSKNRAARNLVRSLGLPLPFPQVLRRDAGPWLARPLADQQAVVGATAGAELVGAVADCLAAAGADTWLSMPAPLAALFRDPGETFGRPARAAEALAEGKSVDALVFDATGIHEVDGLRAVFDFFQPRVSRVVRSGRVVILGRTPEGGTAEAAAAQAALDGFVRSVAKEIGRGGATANLVLVDRGAESRLGAVLRFILSARSAFVTGQPIVVSARAKALAEPSYVRPFERKVVLVTGAARGIGEATARAFAREGAHVLCVDRPTDEGPTSVLARSIGGTPVGVDMSAPDAARILEQALAPFGGVDVLVHNAGVTRDKTLGRMKPEHWQQVLDVNLKAVVKTTGALDRTLREGGRIVCLSSIAGLAGNVGQTAYAASKAGIVGWIRASADRFADRGITVNAIAPGFIETRLTAAIPVAIREVARRLSALSQGGLPTDVAEAIVFLASPGAQGITGRALRVCGGAFVGA